MSPTTSGPRLELWVGSYAYIPPEYAILPYDHTSDNQQTRGKRWFLTQTERLLVVEGGGVVGPGQAGRSEETEVHLGLQSQQGDVEGPRQQASFVGRIVVILIQDYLLGQDLCLSIMRSQVDLASSIHSAVERNARNTTFTSLGLQSFMYLFLFHSTQ